MTIARLFACLFASLSFGTSGKRPRWLIAVILTTVASYQLGYKEMGGAIVGAFAAGFVLLPGRNVDGPPRTSPVDGPMSKQLR